MTPQFTLGLGCDRGTSLATLHQALQQALQLAGAQASQIRAVASIDLKADEPGLLALALEHGWAVRFFRPDELATVAVPHPSEVVRKHTGTPSVSEAAALLVGGNLPMTALVVEKLKHRGADGHNATVSLACCGHYPFLHPVP